MKNLEENNKLIAEFMNLPSFRFGSITKYQTNRESTSELAYPENLDFLSDLEYDTSWDWLMPVVEKIECTTTDDIDNSDNFFNVMIEVFECNINGGDISICEIGNTKREATYKAVVEFIKWYNENN